MGKYFKDSEYIVKKGHFKDSAKVVTAGTAQMQLVEEIGRLLSFFSRYRTEQRLVNLTGLFRTIASKIKANPRVIKEVEDLLKTKIAGPNNLILQLENEIKPTLDLIKSKIAEIEKIRKRFPNYAKDTDRPSLEAKQDIESLEQQIAKLRLEAGISKIEDEIRAIKTSVNEEVEKAIDLFNKKSGVGPLNFTGDAFSDQPFIYVLGIPMDINQLRANANRLGINNNKGSDHILGGLSTLARNIPGVGFVVKVAEFFNKIENSSLKSLLSKQFEIIDKTNLEAPPIKMSYKAILQDIINNRGYINNNPNLIPKDLNAIKKHSQDFIAGVETLQGGIHKPIIGIIVVSLATAAATWFFKLPPKNKYTGGNVPLKGTSTPPPGLRPQPRKPLAPPPARSTYRFNPQGFEL